MVRFISGHVFCPTVLRSSMTHIMRTPLIPHFVYLSHEIALLQKKNLRAAKKMHKKVVSADLNNLHRADPCGARGWPVDAARGLTVSYRHHE